MSTVTSAPKPTTPKRSPKNYKRLFLIFFAAMAFMMAAASINAAYMKFSSLHHDMIQTQALLSQYQNYAEHLSNQEAIRLTRLEQAWRLSESRIHNQEAHIQTLENALAQKSLNSDPTSKIREATLLQEIKTLKDMYLQSQQKINSYEKQLLALAQEIKNSRELNQLIRQEQIKMKSDSQELLKKVSQRAPSQVSISQENLEKALEARLSQFVNADYEHEQKFKDLQKAVENCAKVGELKALEVYYDDRINDLGNNIQNSQKPSSGKGKIVSENPQQLQQLKQEIMKLNMEKEEMRAVINSLLNQQRNSDERINLLETQNIRNNKQPEVRRPVPEVSKEDLRTKPQQPKTVSQKEETQEEENQTENLFEWFQKMMNEQEIQHPSYNPYMAHMNQQQLHRSQQNRNRRQQHHPRGFGDGIEHLLHYL